MVAAAVVGAAVVGATASTISSNKAAGAATKASQNSVQEQQREFDQARSDQAPFRTAGVSALDQISKLYGLDSTDANGNVVKGSGKADFSSFTASPDYQFNLSQGQDAINRSSAAKGGLLSGAAVKAGQQYASGLADQQFGSYYNRLAGVAGIGQSATNTTDQLGANTANNISNAYTNAGNARASAYDQNGQTIANTTSSLANNYLYYKRYNPG
jgi:hypothetical protein